MNCSRLAGRDPWGGSISKEGSSCYAWCDLLEKLQPFLAQAVFEQRKAGGISTRLPQTIDEAAANWIDDGCEHDRHGAGCVLRRRQGRAGSGHDDVWRDGDQFRSRPTNLVGIARTPAGNDPHVAAVGPA